MHPRFVVTVAAVAAVAAMGVLAPSAGDSVACTPAIIDDAGLLTTSTRLAGAMESLRREGIDTIVRTVPSGTTRGHATDLAARCPDLASSDTDAVVVVVNGAGAVEVLAIGRTTSTDTALAEATIRERISAGDPDVASAVAQGLETLWHARSAPAEGLDQPRSPNIWAAARQRRVAGTALAVGSGVAAVTLGAGALRRRRRLLAADIAEAQDRRTALAEAYLDLDAAVVRATQRRASGAVPAAVTASVGAAAQRAGAALLATADVRPTRASGARALAVTCTAAERDLRSAVEAIETAGADGPGVAPVGFGVHAHERTGAH